MNPPGILPAAYIPASTSTVSGKKSTFRSFAGDDRGDQHHRVARADDDRAARLLRQPAGLEGDPLVT